jgi:hypothetical protein
LENLALRHLRRGLQPGHQRAQCVQAVHPGSVTNNVNPRYGGGNEGVPTYSPADYFLKDIDSTPHTS